MAYKQSNLEELIAPLRIQIGDMGVSPTYSDELLHEILRHSVDALGARWHGKYYLDNNGVVYRSPNTTFELSSPPVIQRQDNRAIVLQSSIMIKSGKKFSESGNAVSWRDEEISYSAIEAAKQRGSSLTDDVTELNVLFPVKLAKAKSGRQYGWGTGY